MSSYNLSCKISNQPIFEGQSAVIIFIKSHQIEKSSTVLIDSMAEYSPISLPFFVIYDGEGTFTLDYEKIKQNDLALQALTEISNGTELKYKKLSPVYQHNHRYIYKEPELTKLFGNVTTTNFSDIFDNINDLGYNPNAKISYMVFSSNVYETFTKGHLNNPISQYNNSGQLESVDFIKDAVTFYKQFSVKNKNLKEYVNPQEFELESVYPNLLKKKDSSRWFYGFVEKSLKHSEESMEFFAQARFFMETLKTLKIPFGRPTISTDDDISKEIALKIKAELQNQREEFMESGLLNYNYIIKIVPEFKNKMTLSEFCKHDLVEISSHLSNDNILDLYASMETFLNI